MMLAIEISHDAQSLTDVYLARDLLANARGDSK